MKKGFTLMELMAYIAVIGIIVMVAGQAFVDATKFNVRSRNMITAAQQANEIAGILREDIAQTGTKSWTESVSSNDMFYTDPKVYVDVSSSDHDSSSYTLIRDGSGIDDFTFLKMDYDEDGEYLGVRQIEWSLQDISNGVGNLIRSCKTISGTASNECPKNTPFEVVISGNVSEFSTTPSIPGPEPTEEYSSSSSLTGQIFPEPTSSSSAVEFRLLPRTGSYTDEDLGSLVFKGTVLPTAGGESVTVSDFETNFTTSTPPSTTNITSLYVAEASTDVVDWNTGCYEFTFYPGEVYSFEFRLGYVSNNMRLFQPGKDLFSLGLRKKTDGSRIPSAKVNDFTIYPPTSSQATQFRYGKFSVAGTEPVQACMAFTVAIYSPLTASGTIVIRNFHVDREIAEAYHFPAPTEFYTYNPTDGEDKKNVKAFFVRVEVNRHGEKSVVESKINVPSNGTKATATD